MTRLRLTLAAVLSLGALACGNGYSSPSTPSPTPSPTPPPTTGAPSAAITIPMGAEALGSRAFMPTDLDIAIGTTVTWTNTDSVAHTSTSNGAGWDSGIIAPGAGFSFAYETAGTFPYHCAIHPGMVGTVVVH